LGHLLSSEELSALGRIDLLLQHAGGSFALGVRDAARLRAAIDPALTIPMHYRTRAMGPAGLLFRKVDDYLAATGASFRRAPCEIELGGSAPPPGADVLVMDYE
jgi:L-ascorbate metabolism protein UlaG (beta-lactamase superfamily)